MVFFWPPVLFTTGKWMTNYPVTHFMIWGTFSKSIWRLAVCKHCFTSSRKHDKTPNLANFYWYWELSHLMHQWSMKEITIPMFRWSYGRLSLCSRNERNHGNKSRYVLISCYAFPKTFTTIETLKNTLSNTTWSLSSDILYFWNCFLVVLANYSYTAFLIPQSSDTCCVLATGTLPR